MVLTVSFVLFPGTGFFAPVISGSFRSLSACIGAPEPHDFAVRTNAARRAKIAPGDVRPSHPAPNVRDDREASLLWVRDEREHRFDLPDDAMPGMCDTLARRANQEASLGYVVASGSIVIYHELQYVTGACLRSLSLFSPPSY
jgi:hypothetical protein